MDKLKDKNRSVKLMKAFKGAVHPTIVVVILIVLISGLFFLFTTTQETAQSNPSQTADDYISNYSEQAVTTITADEQTQTIMKQTFSFDFAALDLTLLAAIVANPINLSTAIIQANGLVETYNLNDKIGQTEVAVAAIYQNYVVLVKDHQEYTLRLSANVDRNIEVAASKEIDTIQTISNKEQAKRIGNHPKELEHVVTITPTGDGFYVAPGINPALFRAARFKEGDVLQTINGKDLNDPEELAQAEALIATAETLEFSVLRGGVLITLYLDIPAKSLTISN